MLNVGNQVRKVEYSYATSRISKSIGTARRLVQLLATRIFREDLRLLNGYVVLFWGEENVLHLDKGGGGEICECSKHYVNCLP